MVSKVLVNENKIAETILRLATSVFTPHDFIDVFKRFFPEDWRALVERFGVFGWWSQIYGFDLFFEHADVYSHKSSARL